MSDSPLNALLRPTARSPLATKPQNAVQRTAGGPRHDDSFSKALERRMNPAEQGIARGARDAQRQGAPARKNDAGREAQPARSERPVRPERPARDEPLRERTDARTARGTPDDSERRDRKVSSADAPAQSETPTEPGAANPESAPTPDSAIPDRPPATAAFPAAAAPDGTPASDPAAAASLAALLPNVAARPTTPGIADADGMLRDDAPLDGAGSGVGASLLEKLIAEASGRAASTDAAGAGVAPSPDGVGTTTADDGSATAGTPWKVAAGPTAGDAGAATARAPDANATNFAGATAAQPTLQPDTQLGLHAAGFTAANRVEQPPPQLPVSTPAGQPAWAEDVGGRLVWMVGRHESKAEIVLTPPTLGKLEVSIHVGADQTTAHFVAATSAARDALEQAMPRLREVLQQAGINLGQTNVSTSGEQQAQQHAPGGQRSGRSANAGVGSTESAGTSSASSHWVRTGSGVVDTFA